MYADAHKKLGVMSIGFLLQNRDDAVVWRGPKKNGMLLMRGTISLLTLIPHYNCMCT